LICQEEMEQDREEEGRELDGDEAPAEEKVLAEGFSVGLEGVTQSRIWSP